MNLPVLMVDLKSNLFISSVSNDELRCRRNVDIAYDAGSTVGGAFLDLSLRNLGLGTYSAANYVYEAAVGKEPSEDSDKKPQEVLLKKWTTEAKPFWLTDDEDTPHPYNQRYQRAVYNTMMSAVDM